MWSSIDDKRIKTFTANSKSHIYDESCVLISTYNMISFGGRRSKEADAIMEEIGRREWGLLVLDEVQQLATTTTRHNSSSSQQQLSTSFKKFPNPWPLKK